MSNYALTLSDESESLNYLKEKVLPLALKNDNFKHLARLYFNITVLMQHQDISIDYEMYYIEAMKYACLTCDHNIFIRSIIQVSIDVSEAKRFRVFLSNFEEQVNRLNIEERMAYYFVLSGLCEGTEDELLYLDKIIDSWPSFAATDNESFCHLNTLYIDVLFGKKRYSQAVLIFESYIENLSASEDNISIVQLFCIVAKCYYFLGKLAESDFLIKKAKLLEETNNNINYKYEICEYYYDIGEYNQALKIAAIIIKKCKEDKDILQNTLSLIGNIYFNQGEYDKAREVYLSIVNIDNIHSSGALFFNLADIKLKNNRIINAYILFKAAQFIGHYSKQVSDDNFKLKMIKQIEPSIINEIDCIMEMLLVSEGWIKNFFDKSLLYLKNNLELLTLIKQNSLTIQ